MAAFNASLPLEVQSDQSGRPSMLRPPTKIRDDLKALLPVVHVGKENNLGLSDFPVVDAMQTSTIPAVRPPVPSSKAPLATRSATVKVITNNVTKKPTPTAPSVSSARRMTVTPTASSATLKRSASNASVSSAAADNSKKRPAWDLKGRLQDMEEMTNQLRQHVDMSDSSVSTMSSKLSESEQRVLQLEQFRLQLEQNVRIKETENTQVTNNYEQLKLQLEAQALRHSEHTASLQHRYQIEMDETRRSLESLQRGCAALDAELRIAREENLSLKSTLGQQASILVSAESEARAHKLQISMLEESNQNKAGQINVLQNDLQNARCIIADLEEKLRADEAIRRKLHNTILELKGNIRVFCRVRPALGDENADGSALSHLHFNPSDDRSIDVTVKAESASGQANNKTIPFSFDRVFGSNATQASVFEEISQLVQSALDGYRVCIFAYGQTGSGKTFTMEGPPQGLDNDETRGMIPRAVLQIFEQTQLLQQKGWQYRMEASFVEIYNESIRDLLGSGEEKKHEIKHNDKTGTTSVTEVRVEEVASSKQIFSLLRKAAENRAVGKTQMNERSSRSHSVFILRLIGSNSLTEEKCDGILNLIDLAGSERLSQSGSTGERLKETQAINKSLSSLADVIMALANKDAHIPYRNSKLTYLLQNSLGGNSKTLMFVNISPLPSNASETICSLRFATKVNSCEIGTARRTTKS